MLAKGEERERERERERQERGRKEKNNRRTHLHIKHAFFLRFLLGLILADILSIGFI